MMEKKPERVQNPNVKIELPASLNDPKYIRSDLEFMTDDYKRSIGK